MSVCDVGADKGRMKSLQQIEQVAPMHILGRCFWGLCLDWFKRLDWVGSLRLKVEITVCSGVQDMIWFYIIRA